MFTFFERLPLPSSIRNCFRMLRPLLLFCEALVYALLSGKFAELGAGGVGVCKVAGGGGGGGAGGGGGGLLGKHIMLTFFGERLRVLRSP